jgi:hypothetical protein
MAETTQPKYSADLIRRYRELDRAGGFHREIVEHWPVTLTMDGLRLTCGHEQEGNYGFLDQLGKARGGTEPPSARCDQCVREWLNKAQDE